MDSVTLKLVCSGLKHLTSVFPETRMSSPCHTSAVLVVFMALAVSVGAEQSKERSCDVIGDESSESKMERALLKKLEPLSQIRYATVPCRPRHCAVPTLRPWGGEDRGPHCRVGSAVIV